MALRDYLQLSLTDGLGPVLIRRLIEYAGSAENACGASASDLRQIEGIGEAKATKIHESLRAAGGDVEMQLKRAEELGAKLLTVDEPGYPPLLKEIHDPPPVLYMMGSLEDRDLNALAMVGSRRCSYYGREQAERFGALLGGAGFTVVSGGARGIDSAAHRGAMRHPAGRTITVLGSGLDVVYPRENEGLFKQIAQRGAVITEFPFGTGPTGENFPRRNRIVSGMSRGVFVIEADLRSGALITARLANEDHGRPVFALPGRVDSPMSAGTHQLIRDGAILVTCLEDIINGLHPFPDSVREPGLFDSSDEKTGTGTGFSSSDGAKPVGWAPPTTPTAPKRDIALSDPQRAILGTMREGPVTVDQVIERTGLEAGVVLRELTFLSLKGVAKRVDGQTYVAGKW